MLIGFVVTVAAGVAQFILRFGYFTLLQEIGVVFLGFIGAVIGALCSIFRWRRVSA
jgi:glycopeptide antibiotics resistance protein